MSSDFTNIPPFESSSTSGPEAVAEIGLMLAAYSDEAVAGFVRNKTALANQCYIVDTESGHRFALRILVTQPPDNARREADLQARLASSGIDTPRYLVLRNGELVGEHGGAHFTIARFIGGKHPTTVTPELAQSFGETLARLHLAFEGVELPPSQLQWLTMKNVQAELGACSGPLRDRFDALLRQAELPSTLPRAVLHGDLSMSNVFADMSKVEVVFDLETVEENYRVLDLARTYLSLAMADGDPDIVRQRLFHGYDEVARAAITDDERTNFDNAIRYTAVACAAWCANHGAESFAVDYMSWVSRLSS